MKKKGLLISTIVMVVVLVASLTTATYAWFSATAAVSVDNISITTEATKGLEIAVKTSDASTMGYVNGSLTYDKTNNYFQGTDGWGASIDFQELTGTGKDLGVWQSAVTTFTKSGTVCKIEDGTVVTGMVYVEKTIAASGSLSGYYAPVANSSGSLEMTAQSGTAAETGKYYQLATEAELNAAKYVIPIGYNMNAAGVNTPYGYLIAKSNVSYLDLPISVKSTTDIKAIVCKITIKPENTDSITAWNDYKPGMAASSRLSIANASGTKTVLEPYSYVKLAKSSDTSFSGATEADDVFNVVIAYTTTDAARITTADIYDFVYKLWIEGTDSECINAVTGTGFSVDLAFDYVPEDDSTYKVESGKVTCAKGTFDIIDSTKTK